MKIINTKIKDLKIIKQDCYKDKRGNLRVTHIQKILKKKFIFEYCTTSIKYALRGFHFQYKFQQAKYVNVLKGSIIDCVIDRLLIFDRLLHAAIALNLKSNQN